MRTEGTANKAILVAEDEVFIALDLEAFLEEHHFDVCGIASTAREAVDLAAEHGPALALVDVRLADGSNGLEAVSTLCRRGIPSIVISGHASRREVEAAGAVGLVPKPLDLERLLRLILDVLTSNDDADVLGPRVARPSPKA